MENKMQRMKELIPILVQAAKAYYQEDREIMSNFEYDRLYDEDLAEWLGDQKGLLSWKMDGLTIVLTYRGGELSKAVTRGNGEIGEVITPNARTFVNIPLRIAYQGELTLRGEAIIRYSDFTRINEEIEDVDAKYKNPRNLCSGSVRQLNSRITAERSVRFEAFALVRADGVDFKNSRKEQFEWLKTQGFEVVPYVETFPPTAWCFFTTISPTGIPWGARPSSRAIPLHSSGRMRCGRPRFPTSSGALPVQA